MPSNWKDKIKRANGPKSTQLEIDVRTGPALGTGMGEDGQFQKFNPTHLMQTTNGPKTIHEGERLLAKPDGSFSVTPASALGGQGALKKAEQEQGIKGFAFNPISTVNRMQDQGHTTGNPPAAQTGSAPVIPMLGNISRGGGTPTGNIPVNAPASTPQQAVPQFAPVADTKTGYDPSLIDTPSKNAFANTNTGYDPNLVNTPSKNAFAETGLGYDPSLVNTPSKNAFSETQTGYDPSLVDTPGPGPGQVDFSGVMGGLGAPIDPEAVATVDKENKRDQFGNIIPPEEPVVEEPDVPRTGQTALQQAALGKSRVDETIANRALGQLGGEQEARRAAFAQQLAQQGITGGQAAAAMANFERQSGIERAQMGGQLAEGAQGRALGAATSLAGIEQQEAARAQQKEQFDESLAVQTEQWDKQFGRGEGAQMLTDAQSMDEATWLAKHPNATAADYAKSVETNKTQERIADKQLAQGAEQFTISHAFLEKQFGANEGGRMMTDAAVMDEATWLKQHPNANADDYAKAREGIDANLEGMSIANEQARYVLSDTMQSDAGIDLFDYYSTHQGVTWREDAGASAALQKAYDAQTEAGANLGNFEEWADRQEKALGISSNVMSSTIDMFRNAKDSDGKALYTDTEIDDFTDFLGKMATGQMNMERVELWGVYNEKGDLVKEYSSEDLARKNALESQTLRPSGNTRWMGIDANTGEKVGETATDPIDTFKEKLTDNNIPFDLNNYNQSKTVLGREPTPEEFGLLTRSIEGEAILRDDFSTIEPSQFGELKSIYGQMPDDYKTNNSLSSIVKKIDSDRGAALEAIESGDVVNSGDLFTTKFTSTSDDVTSISQEVKTFVDENKGKFVTINGRQYRVEGYRDTGKKNATPTVELYDPASGNTFKIANQLTPQLVDGQGFPESTTGESDFTWKYWQ